MQERVKVGRRKGGRKGRENNEGENAYQGNDYPLPGKDEKNLVLTIAIS